MSKNLVQVYAVNPLTSISPNDLCYWESGGLDAAITGSDMGIAGINQGNVIFANALGNLTSVDVFNYDSRLDKLTVINLDVTTLNATTLNLTTLTITSLTASRIVATDAGKSLVSVASLTSWIAGTLNRVTSTTDGVGGVLIDISASYVGQASITTLGTIGTGTWHAGIIPGQYGGTGVANTGLTITLAGGAVGKVLSSDVSGNATWAALSGLGVTSAQGTANQVLVNGTSGSGQVGALTFTTPQDIDTTSSPTFARVNAVSTFSTATNDSAFTAGNATTTITASTINLHAFRLVNQVLATGASSLTGLKWIGIGMASPTITGNGTFSAAYNFLGNALVSIATNQYCGYFSVPTGGTVNHAIYGDNLSLGYPTNNPPANGAAILGRVLIGTSTDDGVTPLQVNGNITGTWAGVAIVETKGGTNQTSFTQGDMLYASAANTLSKLAKSTTATRYLANTGSSNNPAWDQVNLANGVTGLLPGGNGGTGINNGSSTITLGGNLATSGAFDCTITLTGTTNVTFPTSGTLITSASVPSLPLSTANGGMGGNITAGGVGEVIYSSATTTYTTLANPSATGRVLRSGSVAAPTWSGYAMPASGTANAFGYWSSTTNFTASNVQANSVLVTDGSSVPSLSTTIPVCSYNGIKWTSVASGAGNVNATTSQVIIRVTDTAAPRTVTLTATSATNSVWIVKDETGGAVTNNITIAMASGNIDGAANVKIITNYGAVRVYFNGTNGFTF